MYVIDGRHLKSRDFKINNKDDLVEVKKKKLVENLYYS